MKRGKLRVLLGAAPGVGKTYELLEEGRRLLGDGHDVVVAVVETHGRAATAAMLDGLPLVPRRTVTHGGVELAEMDLEAVLERSPRIALVDELAHTNAPGSRNPQRWQDVDELLTAGIDVITTVNVQHIESLGDVVEQITGVEQQETVPDAVVRGADQVEVVDLAPESLRDRLAAGLVYPAERVDAALSNYFRLGNLTALRELALLWLADEVDSALKSYRAEHGIGATVIRESGDIDVHVVTHSAAGTRFALPRMSGGALSRKRRVLGFALALVGGPLLTWLLVALRSEDTITSDVLAYQLLVVLVSLVGGLWPAVFAAVMSGFTLSFFFVEPFHTVSIADPRNAWALVLYVVIAVLVSFIVDRAARAARAARRSAAESELLATVAGSVLRGQGAGSALVARIREAFGMAGIRLLSPQGDVIATDGEPLRDDRHFAVPVGTRGTLELHGPELDASERRLLDVAVAQLDSALEQAALQETARAADVLAETDQVRSALLSAVSHDLRRPLAAAVAAVGGLRAAGSGLSAADRAELLATADESLAKLSTLVTDLLDVSRVEAGVLAVSLGDVDAADTMVAAVDELGLGPDTVEFALEPELPPLRADAVLLQRVLVNVLANATRHSPPGSRVRLSTSRLGGTVEIRVVDRGVGVTPERRDEMFAPFQRFGDTDNTTGLGLGLALSRGFMEGMGGTLAAEDTPGGGLTMVIALPAAGGLSPENGV